MNNILVKVLAVVAIVGIIFTLYKAPGNILFEQTLMRQTVMDNFKFKDYTELEVLSTAVESTKSVREKLSEDDLRKELFNSEYSSYPQSINVDSVRNFVVFDMVDSNEKFLGTYKLEYDYSIYAGLTDYKLTEVPKKFK